MLANLARAAARPSLGVVRRAAAATKCSTATPALSVLPKNLRCSSTLSEVLKAEIEEEKLVAFDEGAKCVMPKNLGPQLVCRLLGAEVMSFGFNPKSTGGPERSRHFGCS